MSWSNGSIAIVLAILLVIVVFAPVPGDTRLLYTLHNAAHGPLFGGVALLVLAWQRRRANASTGSWFVEYAIAFVAAIILGVGTEIVQALTGRDASWLDARNDALGALAVLMLCFALDKRTRSRFALPARAAAVCVALGVFAFLVAPVVRTGFEYRQRDRQFPIIADFTRHYDRYFIYQQDAEIGPAAMPESWARRKGEGALRVRMLPGAYPGIEFVEPFPDWTAYRTVVLDLTNPGARDLRFTLRINDAIHNQAFEDRYNGVVMLHAGRREEIRIPLHDVRNAPRGRAMRLDDIYGMMLFLNPPRGAPSEFLLSRVWLE
jgi:hypothetical protein